MPQILSYPPHEPKEDPDTRHVLIFFITGNPGLVDYYEPFLSTLRTLLDENPRPRPQPVSFHVYGRNLAGFDDADHEPFSADRPPHDLEFQIQHVLSALDALTVEAAGPRHGTPFDRVILVGHSVGAFITLEAFHRRLGDRSLTSGILLFPTVAHIALSPSGLRISRLKAVAPAAVERGIHSIAKTATYLLPDWTLSWLLRSAMGFPEHAAGATERFVRSRDGIWQAVHLGKDELNLITEEKWGEELWEVVDEVEAQEHDVPKFFFYFGEHDHWVDNELRDQFIQRRNEHAARQGPEHKRGRTRMMVDEDGIPHAFCISECFSIRGFATYEFVNDN